MFKTGDLSASIDLQNLADIEGLIALGPVEGLQGEITIIDGQSHVTTLIDGKQKTENTFAIGAIFLAYGTASEWTEITLDETLEGLAAVEDFVRKQAIDAGLDLETSFPFRIDATPRRLIYHVIFKSDNEPHTKKLHQNAKIKFNADGSEASIAGVWAAADKMGVFTHPGKRTHLHAVVEQGSGHIDDIELRSGAVLYLPKGVR